MGTLLRSTICHYCGPNGMKATTEDHILPKKFLPRPLAVLPDWFRNQFVVPACEPCNNAKEWFRSTCNCDQCTWVWMVGLAAFVPMHLQARASRVRVVDPAALSRARRHAIERGLTR